MSHRVDSLWFSQVDEQQRAREREESARALAEAHEAVLRIERAIEKARRMNALYRERLVGRRLPE